MKSILVALLCGLGMLVAGGAWAQYPGPQGPIQFSTNCAGSPQMGGAYLCFDTTVNSFYTWNGTAYTGSSRDVWAGGGSAVNSTSAADYYPINGVGAPALAAAEGNAQLDITIATVIKNLKCQLETAGGTVTVAGGTSYVLAIRKNGADTAVTCTIGAAASGCTDVTHTVSFANNDLIDFGATPNGTPTALIPKCTAEADF